MRSPRVLPVLVLLAPILAFSLAERRRLDGLVVTSRGLPLAGATVRIQGQTACTRTDRQGRFTLAKSPGRITATKPGYRIGWMPADDAPLKIQLTPAPNDDHEEYTWTAPDPDVAKPKNCGNCHQEIHREWAASAHARSTANPKFLALFDGKAGKSPHAQEWSLRAQHPDAAGVCVTCHTPTLHDPTLEYDLRPLKDSSLNGIHCDYCHKISAAPTDKLGIRFGRDGYLLSRPRNGDFLNFGPLDDVVRPGESFVHAPFFKESRFCASCHEGVVFGVQAYATYSEWLASPARQAGQQCQSCHMKPSGAMTNIAPGRGGVERDPQTLASHRLAGGAVEMLRKCLELHVEAIPERERIIVKTKLSADHVGHRVPTGFIDRQLLLVVEAWDAVGKPIPVETGPTLNVAAGKALAGKAGWVYAKRLSAEERSPLPFWVPSDHLTDTRLHPRQADRHTFTFPATAAIIRTRVLYRRFWSETAELYGWTDNDYLIIERTTWLQKDPSRPRENPLALLK
jgi:hypothetical protein